ncbi:glutathionylspermidine synthase [Nakamurella sp. UYEF19]|uniref:glutathionylspermidine synthase family protein n=1 Tax=Nakamurella sp. UYEF19 TaxID=1756392 RepID=UPI0033979F71
MRRHQNGAFRQAWQTQIESEGLVYSMTNVGGQDVSYWREAQYYSFTTSETEYLADAANTLFSMFVAAGDHIIENNLFDKMGIPAWAVPAIVQTWNDESTPGRFAPSIYGRFDLRYGNDPELLAADPTLADPKLLEFNADTPTSLLETAVIQWNWLLQNDAAAHRDQWNNVYDALVKAWTRNIDLMRRRTGRKIPIVHFAWSSLDESGEDKFNVLCMADAAREAGLEVKFLFTEEIKMAETQDMTPEPMNGVAVTPCRFYDVDGDDIEVIFKLYPWEQLNEDAFGRSVLWNTLQSGPHSMLWSVFGIEGTTWIEPPYKMMWSNKAILPVLWEMYGDDPERSKFLLPAYFSGEEPAGFTSYAEKPFFGREGANVRLVEAGRMVDSQPGPYGTEGSIRQAYAPLPNFEGLDGPHHPVLGVWMVDGEAVGLGLRESAGLITDNQSFFAPHCIIENESGMTV